MKTQTKEQEFEKFQEHVYRLREVSQEIGYNQALQDVEKILNYKINNHKSITIKYLLKKLKSQLKQLEGKNK